MAVANRQISPVFERAISMPAPRRRVRTQWRIQPRHVQLSFALFFLLVAGLTAYIDGYARMTAMSYQSDHIQGRLASLKLQQNLIRARLLELGNQACVRRWAEANGLVQAAARPIVVGRREAAANRPGSADLREGRLR